ncbi:hypothetical protein [Candidatus Nitrosocosmicus arcticus]|uniref:Uncharacterized protein n=1 Tax=Candidatus Nitrosocosmicus arcticus TaxID=2035267 RepID=A0A557SXF6_9ARCH|nr:hypothetical protein [Candidatus Nitrosocosmicus arcticus]TVP41284.1 hypothetical protein NARC_40249 [Candidatus Nitrosocosmicus arcticus]
MSSWQDVIVRGSDKQFRIRISLSLREIGISQLIGTKDYIEIWLIGGDSITVFYPLKLENFHKAIESQLLLETELPVRNIDDIKYYLKVHVAEIKNTIEQNKSGSKNKKGSL